MRSLIFGATGLLGKALMKAWDGDHVTGVGSATDIRDVRAVMDTVEHEQPEVIVLAAAYTDVDGCETNRDLAFAVNSQGAANIAEAAKQAGSRLLLLSSDYVFDGKKSAPYEVDDPVAPATVYGRSKVEAELRVRQTLPECCIVRTSWLFGVGGKCFPETILRLAAARPEIEVVNDQRGCPTYAPDLAQALIRLCRLGAQGTIHVTNKDDCTWYEFARGIVSGAGLSTTIRPTTSDKFVRPAPRPQYSVLSPASLRLYEIAMPPWQDALTRYLRERSRPG